jgi:flagellar assembly factor FliW
MQVVTTRFGTLEIDQSRLLRFPQGMVGFPELRRYCLIPAEGNGSFIWMQAADSPEVAFLLTNPWLFYPDYDLELEDDLCQTLGVSQPDQLTLLVVVTVPPGQAREMTANLLAPVVINHAALVGRQVVLDDRRYTTRHPLFAVAAPESGGQG